MRLSSKYANLKRKLAWIMASMLLFMFALNGITEVYSYWTKYYQEGKHSYSEVVNTSAGIRDAFPESYWAPLEELLEKHPNWRFQAVYTGTRWELCFLSESEMALSRNLVYSFNANNLGITKEWYSTEIEGAYNWAANTWTPFDSGTWYQISEKALSYVMDPRNFLSEIQIFQFMDGGRCIGKTEEESIEICRKILSKQAPYWNRTGEEANIYTETVEDNPEYAEWLIRESIRASEAESRSVEESIRESSSVEASIQASIEESIAASESESIRASEEAEGITHEASEEESEVESGSEEQVEEPSSETEDPEPPKTIVVKHYHTYAEALGMICFRQNVNEAMVISRLMQEQGTGTSSLISGTRSFTAYPGTANQRYVSGGYYQYFNIGAGGNSQEQIINNGLTQAYDKGWNTRWKGLEGGVQQYASLYIQREQFSLYSQKFNVLAGNNSRLWWGQYMQNATAPQTEARILQRSIEQNGILETPIVFVIPVYEKMPETPQPCPSDDRNPNYKLGSIYLDDRSLTGFNTDITSYGQETFSYDKESVTLNVMSYAPESSLVITAKRGDTSTEISASKQVMDISGVKHGYFSANLPLLEGETKVTVKCVAENENAREYAFSVVREAAPETEPESETEIESESEPESSSEAESSSEPESSSELESSSETETETEPEPTEPEPLCGDVDENEIIDIVDITMMRSHILRYSTLDSRQLYIADIDRDGAISVLDITAIRSFLLHYTPVLRYGK